MKKSHLKLFFALAVVVGLFFAPGLTLIQTTHAQTTTIPTIPYQQVTGVNGSNAAAAGGTLQAPAQPQTSNPFSCNSDLITCATFWVSYFINKVISWAIILGATLVGTALALNQNISNSPAVITGFSVALAFANLAFVLGIIVIAIATILHISSYGIKQLLWKLVVMAVLVNFGLVVTTPIIGFSNSISGYFMNQMAGTSSSGSNNITGFVNNLTNAFSPQSSPGAGVPPNTGGTASTVGSAVGTVAGTAAGLAICGGVAAFTFGVGGLLCVLGGVTGAYLGYHVGQAGGAATSLLSNPNVSDSFLQQLIALVSSAVFLSITAITFIALAVLLLVRYIYLTFLLILLPLAWLGWVFPAFKNQWTKWWSLFIKWTLFPVLALFFVYLALLIAPNVNGAQTNGSSGAVPYLSTALGTTQTATTYPQVGVAQQEMTEIVLCGLILGGLFAANSIGIAGAGAAMGLAKSAGNTVAGYVGRKTKSGAQAVGRRAGDQIKTAGKQYDGRQTTTGLQRIGSRLQNIPGFKGVGVGLANMGSPTALQKGREKDIQDYADANLKSLTNEGIVKRASSRTAFVNPVQAAALAQELAKRNLTDDPKVAPLMTQYVAAADRMGNLEKVTNNRPDLMPQRKNTKTGVTETREEAIARAIKAAKSDITQANAETFNLAATAGGTLNKSGMNNTEVQSAILSLSPAQLANLGSDQSAGSQDRQNNITDAIKNKVAGLGLVPATRGASGKFELDSARLKTLIAAAATPADKQQLENLGKMVKHMESSSNWGSVLGN